MFFSEVLGVRGVEEVISHLVEIRKMSIFRHQSCLTHCENIALLMDSHELGLKLDSKRDWFREQRIKKWKVTSSAHRSGLRSLFPAS